ncbi:MAG: hypothetical protein HUK09_01955 [Bacteroidaceae bacterium]|nr:hypothetical protein [Bacteroidaceae bacterium]
MKLWITLLLATFALLPAQAQDVATPDSLSADAPAAPDATRPMPTLVMPTYSYAAPFSMWGYGFAPYSSWGWGMGNGWALREGFNAQVSMNVMAGWGRNAPSGAGFGQNLAVAYAKPINDRLSLAVGLYANNLSWDRLSQRDVGISAVMRYKVTDWMNVYAYASKSFGGERPALRTLNPYSLWAPYEWGSPDLHVGGAAEFKLGERATLSVHFDYVKFDDQTPFQPWGAMGKQPVQPDRRLLNER